MSECILMTRAQFERMRSALSEVANAMGVTYEVEAMVRVRTESSAYACVAQILVDGVDLTPTPLSCGHDVPEGEGKTGDAVARSEDRSPAGEDPHPGPLPEGEGNVTDGDMNPGEWAAEVEAPVPPPFSRGLVEAPVAERSEVCENCGRAFIRTRKGQRFCKEPACQREQARLYQKSYQEKQRAARI